LAFAPKGALASRRAGWVPNGAPDFPRDGGVELDGVAGYLVKDIPGQLDPLSTITIQIGFRPTFETNEDENRILLDTNIDDYQVWKRNNANGNTLRIELGDSLIKQVAESAYNPLWVTNGWNLLTIASESGDTDLFFNESNLGLGVVSAWSPGLPQEFAIGGGTGGVSLFKGRVFYVKVFNYRKTEVDHLNDWKKAS
jgi:hypothetical protein